VGDKKKLQQGLLDRLQQQQSVPASPLTHCPRSPCPSRSQTPSVFYDNNNVKQMMRQFKVTKTQVDQC
jgi:hypothetical protein